MCLSGDALFLVNELLHSARPLWYYRRSPNLIAPRTIVPFPKRLEHEGPTVSGPSFAPLPPTRKTVDRTAF
jgi:hypothetical protein